LPVRRRLKEEAQVAVAEHMNDDRNRLLDLMTCIDCKQTMKIEGSDPDDGKSFLDIAVKNAGVSKLYGYRVVAGRIHRS
jgi:hypothetical protein